MSHSGRLDLRRSCRCRALHEAAGATSAIIVTSDFHTRRALSIFRKRLPQYEWSVAASSWPGNAAEQYWKHRWWAKSVLDEWEKYSVVAGGRPLALRREC